MKRRFCLGVVVAVLFSSLVSNAGAEVLYSQDFSTPECTTGWSGVANTWAIDSNNEYRATLTPSTSSSSYYNIGGDWSDYSFSVTFRFSGASYSGMTARIRDAGSFYLFRYNSGASKMELLRASSGSFAALASDSQALSAGAQYYSRMTLDGNRILAEIASDAGFSNIVSSIDYEDTSASALTNGGVGFRCYNGSSTLNHAYIVDDIQVEAIPEPATMGLLLSGGLIGIMKMRRN